MSCAFLDKRTGGWIAQYRPLHATAAQRRTLRIPADRIIAGSERESATHFASECEHLCRLLEVSVDRAILEQAADLKAITPDQASALRAGLPAPSHRSEVPTAWTITEAAQQHPSSLREAERSPEQHQRHMRDLAHFTTWSGVHQLSDLTLDLVVRWVDHLRHRGYSWDGRRHRLLYLRRAAAMAGNAGMPDPLGEMILDRREDHEHVEVQGWDMSELLAATAKIAGQADRRVLAGLALGGFCGLRSSEILRVQVGHLSPLGVLTIGKETRKTKAARRDIPLPPRVVEWLRPLMEDPVTGEALPPETLLIRGRGNQHRNRSMTYRRFSELWSPAIATATQRADLTPKHLRKTWLTWAVGTGLPLTLVESYAGHRATSVLAVTSASYLIAHQAVQFRPIAAAMQEELEKIPLAPAAAASAAPAAAAPRT